MPSRMERGEYRSFYVAMADDPDIHALSGQAFKLLFMLKMSLGPAGIGVVYPSTLCDQVGCDKAALEQLMIELEAPKSGNDHGWIERERNIVWIINGLAFEPNFSPQNVKKHVPYIRGLVAQLSPSLAIVGHFKERYPEWFVDEPKRIDRPSLQRTGKGIDTLSASAEKGANGTGSHSSNPDRVSKHKTIQNNTRQESGDLERERPRAREAAAAPLASALGNLPKAAIDFLKVYYPRGKTAAKRRVDVAEQIVATLAHGTELRSGEVVRAYTPERLAKKCSEVIHSRVKDPDKAIVILLQKLADTSDESAPGVGEANTVATEQRRVEREAAGELVHALRWIEHEPDVAGALYDQLDEMGMQPHLPDDQLEDKLFLCNRRITRQALILSAWRKAGAPELVAHVSAA